MKQKNANREIFYQRIDNLMNGFEQAIKRLKAYERLQSSDDIMMAQQTMKN